MLSEKLGYISIKPVIYFKLNIIIAPLVFYMVICLWLRYTIKLKMAEKSFAAGQETYQLIIRKQSNTFAKVKDKDFTYFKRIIEGEVFMKNDTAFLRNIKKHAHDDKNELGIYI
ncbi:hypothetical protein [Mucilaginibacter sp. SG564]|uniref:hypothetical protein n=1 Tax=Mucilaginibacter sp. SG564 TaxID=2587022 RepID=UPI0015542603|nr:hypothetical protein [Mucilaginibacter sp. SG564]NOW98636.1 hypothetical protein [Mucilaginibacter sp. SG564]